MHCIFDNIKIKFTENENKYIIKEYHLDIQKHYVNFTRLGDFIQNKELRDFIIKFDDKYANNIIENGTD
jgi:hypothetical protein